MLVLPAASWVVLLLAQPDAHLDASVELGQSVGEIPQGALDGSSAFSYSSVLTAEVAGRLRTRRDRFRLFYSPNLLLRYREIDGSFSSLQTSDGRPVLVRHTFGVESRHALAPRFSLDNAITFAVGELDFAAASSEGTGAEPSLATVPQLAVLETTSLDFRSRLQGPLVGRYDWFVEGAVTFNIPEGTSEEIPGDVLCVSDPDQSRADSVFASSCVYEANLGTVFPLDSRSRLSFSGGYRGTDIDPGGLFHAATAAGQLRRQFSETWNGDFRQGVLVFFDEGDISVLPLTQLGLEGRLVNQRNFGLTWTSNLQADGIADGVGQQLLLNVSASTQLVARVGRSLELLAQVEGVLVAPDQACPPRLDFDLPNPRDGCPSDLTPEERDREIESLSGGFLRAAATWGFAPRSSLLLRGLYGFRGPHVSRWGSGDVRQLEVSLFAALRVEFSTENNSRR